MESSGANLEAGESATIVMKSSIRMFAAAVAALAPVSGAPEDFDEGVTFGGPSSYLVPDAMGSLTLGADEGFLLMYSGDAESSPWAYNGGLHLSGVPIRFYLGTFSESPAVSNGVFEIWRSDALLSAPSYEPLFALDSAAETAEFNNVDVAISGGTLTIGGSVVATAASIPNMLGGLVGNLDIGSGTSTGNNSLSIGNGFSSGHSSVAIGQNSPSSEGVGSVVIGMGQASGNYSFASGENVVAAGRSAVALGANSTASGWYSVALGTGTATGGWAFATGQSTASGERSTAMSGGVATGDRSVALGHGASAGSLNAVAVGAHNKTFSGSTTTWVGTDPLFTVGNGLDWNESLRSDALLTLKNGKTTLYNKKWSVFTPLADPDTADSADADGVALEVRGHTNLYGKVTLKEPQGDISMGDYN